MTGWESFSVEADIGLPEGWPHFASNQERGRNHRTFLSWAPFTNCPFLPGRSLRKPRGRGLQGCVRKGATGCASSRNPDERTKQYMTRTKRPKWYLLAMAILAVTTVVGCELLGRESTPPTVISTVPVNGATSVDINDNITAAFSESMDPATMTSAHFTVAAGATPVAGTVTYDLPKKSAVFAPAANLSGGTTYTVTVTTGVEDVAGNAMAANKAWTFTTGAAGAGPAPVRLGAAGNYVILAKTGISTVPASDITGDIGLSPAAESYLTGFSQTKATGYSTSPQVTGFLYAADMTAPTPLTMTTAITDMVDAYADAAGRTTPAQTDLGAGDIGGLSISPGLYRWGTSVSIPTNVTFSGGSNDVWILQISGNLTIDEDRSVILSGGARAKNIFWQVAETATLGIDSHFEGIILCQADIILLTGASINGRALAQTDVALDHATVTKPNP